MQIYGMNIQARKIMQNCAGPKVRQNHPAEDDQGTTFNSSQ